MGAKPWYAASEEFVADLLGLTLQPGSGNQIGKKGDMKGIKVLLENKASRGMNITLSRAVALKISEEAMLSGRMPMLAYHSCREDMQGAWVMIPSADLKSYETWPIPHPPDDWIEVTGDTHRVSVRQLIEAGYPTRYGVQFVGLPNRRYRYWRLFHIFEPTSSRYTRKKSLAEDFRNMLRKGEL